MAERRPSRKHAPLPEAARPSLAKPPRPGSREDREQIAANCRDQAYIQGERLRARLRELNP
jgi:hypothetical protein